MDNQHQYTAEDLKRLTLAADCLKDAATLLYQVGSQDCLDWASMIEDILKCYDRRSHAQVGLLPLLLTMAQQIAQK